MPETTSAKELTVALLPVLQVRLFAWAVTLCVMLADDAAMLALLFS
jgi:hypothetical protein